MKDEDESPYLEAMLQHGEREGGCLQATLGLLFPPFEVVGKINI